jgi:hypothetical protein
MNVSFEHKGVITEPQGMMATLIQALSVITSLAIDLVVFMQWHRATIKPYHDPVATGTTSSHGVKYPNRKHWQSCDPRDPGRF